MAEQNYNNDTMNLENKHNIMTAKLANGFKEQATETPIEGPLFGSGLNPGDDRVGGRAKDLGGAAGPPDSAGDGEGGRAFSEETSMSGGNCSAAA